MATLHWKGALAANRRLVTLTLPVMLFVLCVICATAAGVNTVKKVQVGESGFLVARDGVLQEKGLAALRNIVLHHSTWCYVAERSASEKELLGDSGYEESGWPWLTYLNTTRLSNSGVGGTIADLVDELTATKSGEFSVEDVTAYLLRRGDDTRMTRGPGAGEDTYASVYVHVELTKGPWRKNDYGETLFYSPKADDTTGINEVMESVHLKPGRVMAWTDNMPFTLRPPSMSNAEWRYGVIIRFTANAERLSKARERFEALEKTLQERSDSPFPSGQLPDGSTGTLLNEDAIAAVSPRTFQDGRQKTVAVYDGLLLPEQLTALRDYLLSSHPRFRPLLDLKSQDEKSDHSRWSADFEVGDFVTTHYWSMMESLVNSVTKTTGWYPYRLLLTALTSFDDVRVHRNCDKDEDEYTVLVYLNSHYSEESFSETTFFDAAMVPVMEDGEGMDMQEEPDDMDGMDEEEGEEGPGRQQRDAMEGEEEEEREEEGEMDEFGRGPRSTAAPGYDVAGAVQARSGRVIVFHSSILHSTRPPRADIRTIRYTLSIKLAKTEALAKAKMLQQMLEKNRARDSSDDDDEQVRVDLSKALEPSADDNLPDVAVLDGHIVEEQQRTRSSSKQAFDTVFDEL